MNEKISRREFLIATGLSAVGTLATACGANATPTPDRLVALQAENQALRATIEAQPPTPTLAPIPTVTATMVASKGTEYGASACDFASQVIGGNATEWWPNQLTDGSFVPNSCVFVDRRQTDTDLPGEEMNVPQGTIAHVWVDHAGKKQTYEVMGGPNTRIANGFLVARGTWYFRPADYDSKHAGQWVKIDGSFSPVSQWATVNTEPTDLSAAKRQSIAPVPVAPKAVARCEVDKTVIATTDGSTAALIALNDGTGGKKYDGPVANIQMQSGETAVYWDGQKTVTTKGPGTITTTTASLYCPK